MPLKVNQNSYCMKSEACDAPLYYICQYSDFVITSLSTQWCKPDLNMIFWPWTVPGDLQIEDLLWR